MIGATRVSLQMDWDDLRCLERGSGSFGFEIRRIPTEVAIVAVWWCRANSLKSTTVKYLEATSHHVFSARGELVEVVGTHDNMTECKRAQEEHQRLHRLEADLAHMNRLSICSWSHVVPIKAQAILAFYGQALSLVRAILGKIDAHLEKPRTSNDDH
jgi:hypothetical protein